MVTQPTNPEVMEPISVDEMEAVAAEAMQTIADAKTQIILLKEICDNLSDEYKDPLKDGLDQLSDAFDSLSDNIETLMELGEPVPFNAPFPEITEAVQAIEALGHEARLMVVDFTLYDGLYPLFTPVSMQGA